MPMHRHALNWGLDRRNCIWVLLGLAAVGCSGHIGPRLTDPILDGPPSDGHPGPETAGDPSCSAAAKAPQRITLMSELELANAVRDLLGEGALEGVTGIPQARSRTIDLDYVNQMTAKSLASRYEYVTAAGTNLGKSAAPTAPTSCTAAETPVACAERIAATLAERAFRRSIHPDEISDLMDVYRAGAATSHEEGIKALVEAILFAPSATYRRELGSDSSNGTAHLTSWEIADQLSYFFLDSIPDSPLALAAKSDALTSDAAIGAEVTRLVASPRVQSNLTQTLLSWLQADRIFSTVKDPKFADFSTVQGSMYTETEMFVDDLSWRHPSSLDDLLTATHTFVDRGLASLYGIPYPGTSDDRGFLGVELPARERAGVLTQAGLLSIKAAPNTTSIIFRGLFVRGQLLCLPEIRPPSDAATQAKISAQQTDGALTERQKADHRKATSPCKGCHAGFDPLGLTLESYDPIGRYRTADEAGIPIDSKIDGDDFAPVLSGPVSSAVDLAQKLRESGRFKMCLTDRMMTYATNTTLNADDCGVQAVSRALSQGRDTLTDLARAIALSPASRTRTIAPQGGL